MIRLMNYIFLFFTNWQKNLKDKTDSPVKDYKSIGYKGTWYKALYRTTGYKKKLIESIKSWILRKSIKLTILKITNPVKAGMKRKTNVQHKKKLPKCYWNLSLGNNLQFMMKKYSQTHKIHFWNSSMNCELLYMILL